MISRDAKWWTQLRPGKKALGGALLLAALPLLSALIWRSSLYLNLLSRRAAGAVAVQASPGVAEVRRGKIVKTLLLDGELRAVRSRMIFSNTSEDAKIIFLPPEGTLVKAGERLVELDSGTVLDKIKDIEEKILAAENEIVRTRATQESALRDMEVELSKFWLAFEQAKVKARVPAEVVPRREYQDNQLALEKARTEYENQLAKIDQKKKEQAAELQVKTIEREKLNAQLNTAKSNLDGMNIKAPADGMVIYTEHWNERRKLQVGDVVWGGLPLVRLPDLTEMEVLAQVNEVDGPKLSVGDRARILLDSYPEVEISGAIKEIAQTAVAASRMAKTKIFRVVVGLDRTATEIMKPGMSAQVAVVVGEHGPHLLVPRPAVKFDGDAPKVIRLEGEAGRRLVAVTILSSDPTVYAVADNGALKEGDRLLSKWGE